MAGNVLVTGASTGIGHATALRLDREGFRVFAGVRKDEDAERLRSEAGGPLTPVRLDVAEGDSVAAAAEDVRAAVGDEGLAGLVNNAGITVTGPLEFLPLDELRRQLEVNLVGQLAVTQAALPMLRTAGGRIVNVSSIGGLRAIPFLGPYNASKFAVEGLSDSLRQELRPFGVGVVVVEPGSVKTPIWEKGTAAGNALRARLPEEAERLYGGALDAVMRTAGRTEERGIPPDRVADVIARALTARRPKTRYLVGVDARAQLALARLLPNRVTDRIIARAMGR
jgi:NAD(P)-dependent dehydrogenase (short-subunit alcohol dehydrogenase family)